MSNFTIAIVNLELPEFSWGSKTFYPQIICVNMYKNVLTKIFFRKGKNGFDVCHNQSRGHLDRQ
jgi:hypothetical protein